MSQLIVARAERIEPPQDDLIAWWDLRDLAADTQTVSDQSGNGVDLVFGLTTSVESVDPTPAGVEGLAFTTSPASSLTSATFATTVRPYTLCFVARHSGAATDSTRSFGTLRNNTTNVLLTHRYSTGQFRAFVNSGGHDLRASTVDQLFRLYAVQVAADGMVTLWRDGVLVGGPLSGGFVGAVNNLRVGNTWNGNQRAILIYGRALGAEGHAALYRALRRLRYLEYLGELDAATISRYALTVNGEHGFHFGGLTQPLSSDHTGQYLAYVDPDSSVRVGTRTRNRDDWSVVDLGDLRENVLALPMEQDHHNFPALGVDGAGYLHLAVNHHDDPLRYLRSAQPRDVTRWVAERMLGENETSVTYPGFVRLPDGRLLFLYRDGVSGNGDIVLNRFDPGPQTWSRIGDPLLDGSGESPYRSRLALWPDGSVHLAWWYRPVGGQGSDGHDLYYAWSADGGESWQTVDGQALALPIEMDGPALIRTVAAQTALQGIQSPLPDSEGRPHLVYNRMDDDDNNNYFHYWWDGASWQEAQLTTFTGSYPDIQSGSFPFGHAGLAWDQGRLWFLYYHSTLYPDEIRAVELTADPYAHFTALTGAVEFASLPQDEQASAAGIRRVFVTPAYPYGGPEAQYLPSWAQVVELDLALIQAGELDPPGIVTQTTSTLPSSQVISSTTNIAVDTPSIAIPATETRLLVRLRATGANGMSVSVTQGGETFGTLALVTGDLDQTTPWMPLRNSDDLSVVAKITSGSGTLTVATLELGEWRD